MDWAQGNAAVPGTVEESFRAGRLLTLRTRNSAAYKGMDSLLTRSGDTMYVDRLDGRIDLAFYERKTAEWRVEQSRLLREIEAPVKIFDGVRSLASLRAHTGSPKAHTVSSPTDSRILTRPVA